MRDDKEGLLIHEYDGFYEDLKSRFVCAEDGEGTEMERLALMVTTGLMLIAATITRAGKEG